jgi:hypothetical protein
VEALDHAGNQVAAARLLGLSRRALIYRLDLYQIRRPRKGRPPRANAGPRVRRAGAEDMPWVVAKYEEAGIAHSDLTRGLIAMAESNGAPAAVGHLADLDGGNGELGGPFVFDEQCEREIAKKIVRFLLADRRDYERIFCLCSIGQSGLYEECGFRPSEDCAAIPGPLLARRARRQESYGQATVLLSLSPLMLLRPPRKRRTDEP